MSNHEDQINADARQEMFELSRERLEHLAYRAINVLGKKPSEFVETCIDADDPTWAELADYLVPDGNWQMYRDRGEKPVARGTTDVAILELFREMVPAIAPALDRELPDGQVLAIVCGGGGASVFLITPTEHLIN